MEFWGIEVKPGETVMCDPGDEKLLHLSQAALGETKKGSENVSISLKFDDKKLVLGTLSAEKCPQVSYDLIFERDFELSHSSKSASVYFCGYKTLLPEEEEPPAFDSDEDDEDEEEVKQDVPQITENGKPEGKGKEAKFEAKADAAASKPKGILAVQDLKKAQKDDDDSDEDESDESDEDDELSDDDDVEMGEDDSSDEEDESDDEEDEETPKKPETGKKRAAETALKTPVSDKKAKVATPSVQKSGGDKKGVHVATPHPAKLAGKTPANNDKSMQKSPKSGGSVACKSCTKTFNSESALQAHSKAKHAAK